MDDMIKEIFNVIKEAEPFTTTTSASASTGTPQTDETKSAPENPTPETPKQDTDKNDLVSSVKEKKYQPDLHDEILKTITFYYSEGE